MLVVLHEITERVRDQQRLQGVLEEQSRVASALQASMVPPRLPDVAGIELASQYLPAGDGREVGGDFLDVFGLGQQTWAFMLGDVSGKGATAAAVAAAARYTLRALADADVPPSETLQEVNASLLSHTDLERHCTLVYGQLRPTGEGCSVVFTLAGHLPTDGAARDGTRGGGGQPGNRAGAVRPSPSSRTPRCLLAPGDLLCVFTDGLVEARRGWRHVRRRRGSPTCFAATPTSRRRSSRTSWSTQSTTYHGQQLADDLAVLLIKSAPGDQPS